jgi:hypothetical protein
MSTLLRVERGAVIYRDGVIECRNIFHWCIPVLPLLQDKNMLIPRIYYSKLR